MLSVFEKEFEMKYKKLFSLNVMALCCVLGFFTKKMINPIANVITESLHIPGGISTGFSIMFLIIAAELLQIRHAGVMMGTVQGLLALAFGRVGSMGLFAPIGYIIPGLAIDVVYRLLTPEKNLQNRPHGSCKWFGSSHGLCDRKYPCFPAAR